MNPNTNVDSSYKQFTLVHLKRCARIFKFETECASTYFQEILDTTANSIHLTTLIFAEKRTRLLSGFIKEEPI